MEFPHISVTTHYARHAAKEAPWCYCDCAYYFFPVTHFVLLIHAKQVGFATEFPSGEHSASNLKHDEFFQLLLQKKETYQRIPEERFDIERYVYVFP